MSNNPILNELYEVRSRILAEHPHDLREHLDDEWRRLKSQGHPVADIRQRSIHIHQREPQQDLLMLGKAE